MKQSGFHMYCKTDEFQKIIPDLIKEYRNEKKKEAEAEGVQFKPDGYLTTLHAVKCISWGGLTNSEKEEYHEMARKAAEEFRSTQDR